MNNTSLKQMAKMAAKRMASGFWKDENKRRQETLTLLENKGEDTSQARQFFVTNTKYQIDYEYNKEDEELYARAKQAFLTCGAETALSALIDQEVMDDMDDAAKQRYIFNLSSKLQEFRERFDREQKFNLQVISV